MRGLYAIIDVESLAARELDPLRFAEAVLRCRPAAVQVRDKRRGAGPALALLREIAPLAQQRAVPVYANDRADLALLAGASGVHLGQDDLPAAEARRLFAAHGRAAALGMSVHNAAELERALAAEPDYIALGPVFTTRSKKNPDRELGLDGLATLAAATRSRSDKPRVAIGGIDAATAPAIRGVCEAAAVIAALIDERAADPYEHAARVAADIHRALGGAP